MIETNKIYQEPCLDTLKRMDDNSIDCVITSPPYWQLRDYGYEGQWGLEPTFQEYLEHLWLMMDEIWRVLKDDGSAWINLGDTYSGSGGSGGDYNEGGLRDGQPKVSPPKTSIKSKCLLLLPHRFAIGCIDRGWVMRNDIIWAKRNGMPESVTDRFSKKHEYMFFMTKQTKYYFNLDAIKDRLKDSSVKRLSQNIELQEGSFVPGKTNGKMKAVGNITTKIPEENNEMFGSPRARQHRKSKFGDIDLYSGNEYKPTEDSKNPGDVSDFWDVPTKSNKAKHYASYNDGLLLKPVLAGCPEGGIIYDPFMGTGSTAEVALRSNRLFIGSEMKDEYCQIADKRLEPFLKSPTLF